MIKSGAGADEAQKLLSAVMLKSVEKLAAGSYGFFVIPKERMDSNFNKVVDQWELYI
jgi:hypothetical protein